MNSYFNLAYLPNNFLSLSVHACVRACVHVTRAWVPLEAGGGCSTGSCELSAWALGSELGFSEEPQCRDQVGRRSRLSGVWLSLSSRRGGVTSSKGRLASL